MNRLNFHHLLDALPDPVVAADATNHIIYVNRATEQLLGWPADDLIGKPVITLVPPRFQEAHLHGFDRYLATRVPKIVGRRMRVAALCKDGAEIDIELSLAALPSGEEPLFIASLWDLRERVELEQIVSSISHDLKNPLTALRGQAQLLQRRMERMAPEDHERILRGLESIITTATGMNRLLNDLVDMARLRVGRALQLDRGPTDLVVLAREIVEAQPPTQQHLLSVETATPSLVGHWDSARLERVLGNLISNAIKYSPDGARVTIGLRLEERADGPVAVLTVQDRGIGIPATDLQRIFERRDGPPQRKGHSLGAGGGLAAARQVIEQHGGTIAVESREGEGACFTIRLPLTVADRGRVQP